MILTITLNPSVDTLYELKHLELNSVNRVSPLKVLGGKGVNAARVASILGSKTIVSGFLGGYNGKFFHNNLNKLVPQNRMNDEFVTCEGETRNCITIMHDDEQQTQINEPGPTIGKKNIETLNNKLTDIIKHDSIDIIVLSGSIPMGVDNDIYYQLISFISNISPESKIILDTSQSVLKDTLDLCLKNNVFPYAIKPNINELREIANSDSNNIAELINTCHMDNIPVVIISKGADGCFAKIGKQQYTATVPKIEAVNPTGSGDATVGALAFALEHELNNEAILKSAMAAGESNALEEKIGFITESNYETYYKQIKVKKINKVGL